MKINKAYIDWLQANYPDSDHTKDLTRDYRAQESQTKFEALCQEIWSKEKVTAKGNEDSYHAWRDNEENWSDFSKQIRK